MYHFIKNYIISVLVKIFRRINIKSSIAMLIILTMRLSSIYSSTLYQTGLQANKTKFQTPFSASFTSYHEHAHLVWRFYQLNVTNFRYSFSRNAYTSVCHGLKTSPMALILQPYCIHCENTTFRVILKMVHPKRSKEKEPK